MLEVPIVIITCDKFHNKVEQFRYNYAVNSIISIKNNFLYPHKIIVVDNGSSDLMVNTLKLWEKNQIIYKAILNKENTGIAYPKNQGIKAIDFKHDFIMVTDSDIVMPFMRPKCVLTYMVEYMYKFSEIGMIGVDLNRDNLFPHELDWWIRLRQHPLNKPLFAIIAIGFWGSLFRRKDYDQYNKLYGGFQCKSKYGQTDEHFRNFLTKKGKEIGVFKGKRDKQNKETLPYYGIHLGRTEEVGSEGFYFKKNQRYIVEQLGKKENK